jgi:RNA polymerase sigma factor (sigma-70 family)
MDVTALLQAAAHGDPDAWNALVARYNGLVWSVARSHRLDGADAADVTQTTWLRLVEHLGDIRDPDRLGAWLATTARHESLRLLRMGQRHVLTDGEAFADVADGRSVEDRLITGERDAALWRGFATLDERCRSLLRLLVADPAPAYEEIGAALGLAIGSIGPMRARCLERLRVRIEGFGIRTPADDSV